MLSSTSEERNMTCRGKWALTVIVVVMGCAALVSMKKEKTPTTAVRMTKPAVATSSLPRKFSEQFDMYDANGDGVIDKHEFVAALSAKSGMPMAVLNMPRFGLKLDELYWRALAMSAPEDAREEEAKQGITKGHVARMIRRYGFKLSYDRNALRSLLHSFLHGRSLQMRSDSTSPTTTLSPDMIAAFGLILYGNLNSEQKKTWQEVRAEKGTLPRGARCGVPPAKKWCGGYSCGASTKSLAKYACCKKPRAVGKFATSHAQCGCCTSEREIEGVCVWDGSLVEKRNGLARLDSVVVGDEVHVGDGHFDTVIYVEEPSLVDMVTIKFGVTDGIRRNETELMVTRNHMVVKKDGALVVGGDLQVGDEVGCGMSGKSCVVMRVSRNGRGLARSIFLLHSNHFIANGIQTSSFTDSPRVMNALLAGIINPARWIWKCSCMSRDHPAFFMIRLANRVFSWTIDPLVRSRAWRETAHKMFGMMTHSS